MLTALLVVAIVSTITVPIATAWHYQRGWLRKRRAKRVIVHTSDDQSIEGTVREVSCDGIVLTAALLVDGAHALAGDVWIPRSKIVLVQQPTAISSD